MRVTRARRAGAAALLLLTVTACSSGQGTPAPAAPAGGAGSGPIRIAYLQKQGDQQYFIDQANGAKEAAAELGAQVTVVDLGDDANKAISEMDTAIAQGANAIAIVVPDQQVGPQVIQRAAQAGIPVLASDDAIKDATGRAAPFVGFDGTAMGTEVGRKAAELYTAAGWSAADTRVLRVSKEDLSVCEDRVNGATAAFQTAGPDVPVIRVGTDATVVNAQDKTAAVITANPGVQHWVVYGCNDESETGAVTALQNAGVKPADIIGVGLGAYLTCKDWKAGLDTGNRAALFIDGGEVGRLAVDALVKAAKDGSGLPPTTIARTRMVDKATWQDAGVVCT